MTVNNLEQLSNAISSLTLEELLQLLKVMSNKLGVDLERVLYGSGTEQAAGSTDDASKPSKKALYTVTVTAYPAEKKVEVIKKVKSLLNHPMALSEVKAMVEALPFKVRENVLLEEKDELVKEFKDLCTLEVVEVK